MSTTTGTKLKYSDYFQGATIASSAIAGSAFVANVSTPSIPPGEITGIFSLIALVSGILSQWLQSKGD